MSEPPLFAKHDATENGEYLVSADGAKRWHLPALAAQLHKHIEERKPALGLIALGAELTVPRAYAIQRAVAALRESRGEASCGYKVGCTSPAIRAALGIGESVFGRLWASEQREGGAELCFGDYNELAIEGELGVVLLSTDGGVAEWEVEYAPVVELHHGADGCQRMVVVVVLLLLCWWLWLWLWWWCWCWWCWCWCWCCCCSYR